MLKSFRMVRAANIAALKQCLLFLGVSAFLASGARSALAQSTNIAEVLQVTTGHGAQLLPLTGTNVSAGLLGGTQIGLSNTRSAKRYPGLEMTDAMGMKHVDPTKWVRLSVSEPATLYVDVDGVWDYLPPFLSPEYGWAPSAETFSDGVVFQKHVEPGEVWLGANAFPPATFVSRTYQAAIAPRNGAPGNNPPFARPDFYGLGGAASLMVHAHHGVTANDADTNGDELTAALVKPPVFGDVQLNADGSFTYTPGTNFTRFDSFQYRVHDGTTNGNVAIVNILNGQELHQSDQHKMHDLSALASEHEQVFELAPHHAATHIVAASGNWSDPATWMNGILPVDHANVLIPLGRTLTVDHQVTATMKTVRADGVLRFAPEVDTELRADTVLVNVTGGFEMGTPDRPIAEG